MKPQLQQPWKPEHGIWSPFLAALAMALFPTQICAEVGKTRLLPALTLTLSRYVEWPATARAKEDRPYFFIGVYDSDTWFRAFQALSGERIHGRSVRVIRLRDGMDADDLRRCQVIFTSRGSVLPMLKSVAVRGEVLIVTDVTGAAGACNAGIEFVPNQTKLGFEICLDFLKASKLQTKASVLRLAKQVHRG